LTFLFYALQICSRRSSTAQDRRNAKHFSLPADHGNLATRQIASVQHTSFGSCAAVSLIAA